MAFEGTAQEEAERLEREGRIEEAVKAFIGAGSLADAARVFAKVKRHLEAAELLMGALRVAPSEVAKLRGQKRRLAHRAAFYFAAARHYDEALAILEALGDLAGAGEVRRHAREKGKRSVPEERVSEPAMPPPSSRRHALAALVDDAAAPPLVAGSEEEELEMLLAVSAELPSYRDAAARAVCLARKLSRLDRDLHGFVRPLLSTGVICPKDLEAFYDLARLYESHNHHGRARRVYQQIEAYQPLYRDAARRADILQSRSRLGGSRGEVDELSDEAVNERWESHQRLPEIHSSASEALESRPVLRSGPPAVEHSTSMPPEDRRSTGPPRPSVAGSGLVAGTLIGSRYRVKRQIGEGGTSEIYEVLDLDLDTLIALKLFSAAVDSGDLLTRCRRELMLARDVIHANIVRVYDIGVHQDRRFMTMEMLDGTDLRDVMEECPPTWMQSVSYLIQACNGLHAAHLHGVVHRDVKPENFFVARSEQVKVMDFGIAMRATDTDEIILDGRTAGTPVYMSPEQIRDYSGVTPVSDVYSIGVVAYELFTGEVPFDSDNPRTLMFMHLTAKAPPPSWLEHELPADLDSLILQALEKEPDQRPKSCREMAERLEAIHEKMS